MDAAFIGLLMTNYVLVEEASHRIHTLCHSTREIMINNAVLLS